MKKIDIHTHVLAFPEFCPPRPDGGKILSAEQQIEVHRKLNVDKAVLLPSGGMEGQWHLLSTENCMYVGDGGSQELETAKELGMQAAQAMWYRKHDFEKYQAAIRPDFVQIPEPMDLLPLIE